MDKITDRLGSIIRAGDILLWDAEEIYRHKSITSPRGVTWVAGRIEPNLLDIIIVEVSSNWRCTYPIGNKLPSIRPSRWRKLVSKDWWDVWGVQ
jgi:hypothetical protein